MKSGTETLRWLAANSPRWFAEFPRDKAFMCYHAKHGWIVADPWDKDGPDVAGRMRPGRQVIWAWDVWDMDELPKAPPGRLVSDYRHKRKIIA